MFRFTIRDVLWLMVVVGLAIAWFMEHRQHAGTIRELNDANKGKLSAETGWQWCVVEHNKTMRLLEESGLVITDHADGKTTIEKRCE